MKLKLVIIAAALALIISNTYAQIGVNTTSPASSFDVRGSAAFNTKSISTTYTLTSTDRTIIFTGSSATTITLPSASTCVGREIWIKNSSATNPSPVITLATVSSQTIDGSSSWTLSNSYEAVLISSDGSNWIVKQQIVPSSVNYDWKQNGNNLSALKNLGTTSSADLPLITNNTERMRITTAGNIGIGTTSPSTDFSMGGTTTRTVGLERNTTAATAGSAITFQSGGAYSGGTNLNGGDANLVAGTSTGTGTSNIYFKTSSAGSTGTSDNTPSTRLTVSGNKAGVGTTSPTNTLDVYSASNPIRIEGLQTSSSSSDNNLSATSTGVVNKAILGGSNFIGYITSDFTVTTTNTIFKITAQNETLDLGNEYNNTTGVFTPTATGTYIFEIELNATGSSATSSDYGGTSHADRNVMGFVDGGTNQWIGRFNYELSNDARSYYCKGVVNLSQGSSYYFGVAVISSTTITAYPAASVLGTRFSIYRLQ